MTVSKDFASGSITLSQEKIEQVKELMKKSLVDFENVSHIVCASLVDDGHDFDKEAEVER